MNREEKGTKENVQILHHRIDEFGSVISALNNYFRLDFEGDHASVLLNPETPGHHQTENPQIPIKNHKRKKSNSNWERFSFFEQVEYIRSIIKSQTIVARKMNVDIDDNVIESIIEQLGIIF